MTEHPPWLSPALMLAVTSFLCGPAASAQEEFPEISKLVPADGAAGHRLGSAAAASGSRVLLGAPGWTGTHSSQGAAYLVRRDVDGFVWEATLSASLPMAFDGFGSAVSLDQDLAVLGAPQADDRGSSSGAALVFRSADGSWREEARLTLPVGISFDQFGRAVAVHQDRVLVGAPLHDVLGLRDRGVAWLFRYDGASWLPEVRLDPADGRLADGFGSAVALSGNRAVVGAPRHDAAAANAGCVYVFQFDGSSWNQVQKLMPAGLAAEDTFGSALALDGDRLAVAAPTRDRGALDTGAVWTFRFDGSAFVEEQELFAADAPSRAQFGFSLALEGDLLAVGAPGDDDGGFGAGAMYLFRDGDSGLQLVVKRVAGDAAAGDRAGSAVAVAPTFVTLGADLDDDRGFSSGAAYSFDRPTPGFMLVADPANANAGDVVTFRLQQGEPGAQFLLFLVERNGRPTNQLLARGTLAGDGSWSGSDRTPPGVQDLTLVLRAYQTRQSGEVDPSNDLEVAVSGSSRGRGRSR